MIYKYYMPYQINCCGFDVTYGPHLIRIRGHGEVDSEQYSRKHEVDGFSGCGVLIKKSALEEVGLFDESF